MATRPLVANFSTASSPCAKIKRHGWVKPKRGYDKLNVDGSFDPDLLEGAYGAVLRDSTSKFIGAGNGKLEWCGDVLLMTEATTLRLGLNLAATLGCNRLKVNSDNDEVSETIINGGWSYGLATAIFDDCYHSACDSSHVIF
ncbi:unnamed protein product [Triticum turgidum subsp. durum]|uniref:RNase H type-1 domain-containing protein n=1 Tax=Triticum turgidum subsp. durum TaxID=4567 RepID=A0A9R0R1E4_TRITD|nr:unnamed protein product [Triticum turgidum subsp. durum]